MRRFCANKMELKIGDIVLCSVKKIEGTSVLVEIEGNGAGAIFLSEIAAGRIRNLREYVVINKKIVCKVLSIDKGNVQLSLRRVTAKERDEALSRYKREKTFITLIKALVKNHENVLETIKKEYALADFIEEAKSNSSLLSKFFKKPEAELIIKAIQEKKETEKKVRKIFILRTLSENGLTDIKSIVLRKDADVRYLGSAQYSITAIGSDFKEANNILEKALKEIEDKARGKKILFEVKEE